MNQSPTFAPNAPLAGAGAMLLAGAAFAGINVLTQWATAGLGVPSATLAFWQYALALIAFLPSLMANGVRAFRTRHPVRHVVRVLFAAAGVQFFIGALAHGVPIGQVIAIDMTSPFMVLLGARIVLGERIGPARAGAAAVGFAGALLILAPWSDAFTPWSLLPLGAAAMWAGSTVMTRDLARVERSDAVTVYLLVLLTPINAVVLAASSGASAAAMVPATGTALVAVLLLAALTAAAQWLLTFAYGRAEAAFLQPFDNVRLPMSVLAGFLAFHYVPDGALWTGSALIIGASLFILKREGRGAGDRLAAA